MHEEIRGSCLVLIESDDDTRRALQELELTISRVFNRRAWKKIMLSSKFLALAKVMNSFAKR